MEPMYYDMPTHLTHQLMTWITRFVNANTATGVGHVRAVANQMRLSTPAPSVGRHVDPRATARV
jgi:hypothetical protein